MYLYYCKGRFGVGVGVNFNKTQSKFLYSLYTHDCTATQSSNVIVKLADDTTNHRSPTTMRRATERRWAPWLNVVRRTTSHSTSTRPRSWWWISGDRAEYTHTPITIDKTPVERVSSFKFLGVHITEDLTWSAHTDAVLKKAHQHLFFLRRLRKFGTSPRILRSFYTCTVESILTGCITAWFGNSTAGNRKALQRVMWTDRHIVGSKLPSLQDNLHQVVYKESPEDYQGLQPPVPQTALSAALRKTSPQHPIPH